MSLWRQHADISWPVIAVPAWKLNGAHATCLFLDRESWGAGVLLRCSSQVRLNLMVRARPARRKDTPHNLSVLKRCPKTLAFAFGLRLRSKTRCFKTRVLGRRLPNGKPEERLRFRALRSKTLVFKKRIAIIFCDLKASLGARACV